MIIRVQKGVKKSMRRIHGIAASTGIAIARAYELTVPTLTVHKKTIQHPQLEIERLDQAIDKAKKELEKIRDHTEHQLDSDHAQIFSAHILILSDPEFIQPIKDMIVDYERNAEYALQETAKHFISLFENMDNDYIQERAADIIDVTNRVTAHLLGVSLPNPALIDKEVIMIAHDLTPSDTAQLNKQYVRGFVTNIGGHTSHSAIMARSLEIPAVVGTDRITKEVEQGELVIVDGQNGVVIVRPTEEELAKYNKKLAILTEQKKLWKTFKHEPTLTKDNIQVVLAGNIGTPNDVTSVLENGGESVGLYRTEFLYMNEPELPSEATQFEAYKSVLEQMDEKPVVVRTLDIGGDKHLPYLDLPKELNPFLGFRAIRYLLAHEDIFRTQLRALLRASVYGHLKIMFPMIATLEEFREAKRLLLEEKVRLESHGVKVADNIEVGMMIEIPATAIMAHQFAKEVDFFSIGTNDLIQYTFAADRMNERVSYLYQPYHPAILNLIKRVIDAAHAEGKWVGMCGEMAGDPQAIPILLGLGLDEFSMGAPSILPARAQISKLSKAELHALANDLLTMGTSEEVLKHIGAHM